MPDELRMITFECKGEAKLLNPSGNQGDAPQKQNEGISREKANELNRKAEEAAEKIEREVRKHLPPYVSVQASVQFSTGGSLVLAGTIALLSGIR